MNFNAKFLDPSAVLGQLSIKEGNTVADFGCGSGYFSLALAKLVGENGTVYAIDILPQSLESVESRAKMGGITNIITCRANLENKEGSTLAKESTDWVILKDVLFQNDKKENILKEANRVLRPGGKALIVEWSGKDDAMGPEKKLRIDPEKLKEEIQKAGFSIDKEFSAGDFHYAIVAVKG